MLTEPADLDRDELVQNLKDHWSIDVVSIAYEAVGFGSQHWIATDAAGTRWFVTADHLTPPENHAFRRLSSAFRTAAALREHGGLDFVLAPSTSRTGEVLIRIGSAWALSIRPYVPAVPLEPKGPVEETNDRVRAAELVAELHAATPTLPPDSVPRESFELAAIPRLRETLARLDRPWTSGPFGEPARKLLAESRTAVVDLIDRYESMGAAAHARQSDWVITHGEPHGTNILLGANDQLFLIDWDTALIGPKERDLWMILDDDGPEWLAYRGKRRAGDLRPEILELYRIEWVLSEISGYTGRFRRPHSATADDHASWADLQSYLPID